MADRRGWPRDSQPWCSCRCITPPRSLRAAVPETLRRVATLARGELAHVGGPGRKVRRAVKHQKDAGCHRVAWEAVQASEERVGGGHDLTRSRTI